MPETATRRAGAREWVGLGLLALPTVLLGLDVTVLYLVLPSMAAALDPSATQTLWIMDAYGSSSPDTSSRWAPWATASADVACC